MKIYKHEGKGHYIGSCIIVLAEDYNQAWEIIRKELNLIGLAGEELNITYLGFADSPQLIYSYNGDY